MSETDSSEDRPSQGEEAAAADPSPWSGIITAVDSVQQALGGCPAAAKAMGISLNSVGQMAAIFRKSKGLAEEITAQGAFLREAEEDLADARGVKEAMEIRQVLSSSVMEPKKVGS